MISNADNLVKQGLLQRPLDFGFVMGAPNAQECSLRQLGHLVSMLSPGDTWTSIGVGKFEMPLAYMAICMGGHVRVGLEDNNKSPDGTLATNVDLVKHVVEIAKAMGREIANPAEAREILSMPAENADWILEKLDPKVPRPPSLPYSEDPSLLPPHFGGPPLPSLQAQAASPIMPLASRATPHQVELKSLVTDWSPYEDLEPVGGDSLEMKPKASVAA